MARERVLPTATMSLAFRLQGEPLRVFGADDDVSGELVGHAIVGGVRSRFYVRDISSPACSVGAQLNPGAASLVLGVPAGELTERHTRLDELWGPLAEEVREQLALAGSPERALDVFASMLMSRLPPVDNTHPAIAHALRRLSLQDDVRAIVAETGYSHRQFTALFRAAVGLNPKLYSRILRFQGAIERLSTTTEPSWAQIAASSGYSDQSHLIREFGEFAGLTPRSYERIAPINRNHVPVLNSRLTR